MAINSTYKLAAGALLALSIALSGVGTWWLNSSGKPSTSQSEHKLPTNRSELHNAALTGKSELISKLIKKGSRLEGRDSQSNTPLLLAAASGSRQAVLSLLGEGASIDAQNAEGNTALHLAAASGHYQTVADLLAYGANNIRKNFKGQHPLDSAVSELSENHSLCVEVFKHFGLEDADDYDKFIQHKMKSEELDLSKRSESVVKSAYKFANRH